MVFAAYLLENAILGLFRGGAFAPNYFKPHSCGFSANAWPHHGVFAAFHIFYHSVN